MLTVLIALGNLHKTDENRTYLGNFMTTAYAWTGNPCANGNYPETLHTVACNSLPFGSVVYIEDVGYRVVEDRGPGSMPSEWLDIYMGDTETCLQWGIQYKDVWLIDKD